MEKTTKQALQWGAIIGLAVAASGLNSCDAIKSSLEQRAEKQKQELFSKLDEYVLYHSYKIDPKRTSSEGLAIRDYNNQNYKGLWDLKNKLNIDTHTMGEFYEERGVPVWNAEKLRRDYASN